MEEPDSNPTGFKLYGLVWHVADRKSVNEPDDIGGAFGVSVALAADGRPFVPVFTERRLAERYAERLNDPDAVPFEMSPHLWLKFLEYLVQAGHEYIAPDPEPQGRLRIAPVTAVLRAARNSLDQPGGPSLA